MISKEFTINCGDGFHLRPAQVLMEAVTPFASEVLLKVGDTVEANAKSILGLMSLGLEKGTHVIMLADGPDEEEAMAVIGKLFDDNFGE